jgi:hypothetical protein
MSRSGRRVAALAAAGLGAALPVADAAAAAPSEVVTLRSARVSATKDTATFPLVRGSAAGKPAWFVITDSSSRPTRCGGGSTGRRGCGARSAPAPSSAPRSATG